MGFREISCAEGFSKLGALRNPRDFWSYKGIMGVFSMPYMSATFENTGSRNCVALPNVLRFFVGEGHGSFECRNATVSTTSNVSPCILLPKRCILFESNLCLACCGEEVRALDEIPLQL